MILNLKNEKSIFPSLRSKLALKVATELFLHVKQLNPSIILSFFENLYLLIFVLLPATLLTFEDFFFSG